MSHYTVIGIDLAKRKFHIVGLNKALEKALSQSISREDFFEKFLPKLEFPQKFAFEACGGCHYVAQRLTELGHEVIVVKPKDVKIYAKARQKNDANDALAICKAALDNHLKRVIPKTKEQQSIAYLHKSRQNLIQQRIQRSNALITSLQEFGFIVKCGKSRFANACIDYIEKAKLEGYLDDDVHAEMMEDCKEIYNLLEREVKLYKILVQKNKGSEIATRLEEIPGIGPINASILSNKSVKQYEQAKDFAASLGLVPKQNTTGGKIQLGSITKQGDRYARTMLIQGARSVIMRSHRKDCVNKSDQIYQFIERLESKGKGYNVICVAVANKLARIAYAIITKNESYVA